MREPARTSPRPLAISLARRISRESDSNDRRFLFLIALFLEYTKGKRERCLLRVKVYIHMCDVRVDGNETGLISFSSDRRGGLNFTREYD